MTDPKRSRPDPQIPPHTERLMPAHSESEESASPASKMPTSLRSTSDRSRHAPPISSKGSESSRARVGGVLALIALIIGGAVWLFLSPEEGQKPAQVTEEMEEVTAPPAEGTKIPPAPVDTAMEPIKPATAVPSTYVIERGDTLTKIATKLYGDPKKWTAIAKANPGLDVNRLKVGQVIHLPDPPAKQKQD